MKEGLYKVNIKKGWKRTGLFLKVFFITLVVMGLAAAGLPVVKRFVAGVFSSRHVESLRNAAVEQVFSDVPVLNANAGAIALLKEEGVVRGYGDGTFHPEDKIRREEFTKIVVAALKANPYPLSNHHCFSDVKNEWFAPYVCYAKKKQFVSGYGDGSFGTGKTITVYEAVSMLNRAFGSNLSASALQENDDLTRGMAAGLLASAMGIVR